MAADLSAKFTFISFLSFSNVLSFTVCGKECTHSYTNKLVQAAIEASLAHRL